MEATLNFRSVVENNDQEALGAIFRKSPGKGHKLFARLHETDYKKLNNVLYSFQTLAENLEEEKLLDVVRRLMWMLNEESGNNCPNAALALGHIAQIRPQAVLPHLPVLEIYAEDPSSQMSRAIRKSIAMIKMALTQTLYC
jgi:hypothetical protein